MDLFAFNGAVVGLESTSVAPTNETATSKNDALSRLSAPPPAPAKRPPRQSDSEALAAGTIEREPGVKKSLRNLSRVAPVPEDRAKDQQQQEQVSQAGPFSIHRVHQQQQQQQQQQAPAPPLKSALKRKQEEASAAAAASIGSVQRAAKPVRSAVGKRAAPTPAATTGALLEAASRLQAPVETLDDADLSAGDVPLSAAPPQPAAAPLTIMGKALARDAEAEAEEATRLAELAKERAAKRVRREESTIRRVQEQKEALQKRQKAVSYRQPELEADVEAARDRLFGAPPPHAVAETSSSDDDDDDDAIAEAQAEAAVAKEEQAVADGALPESTDLKELLHRRLHRGVESMGITKLTRVQRLAWASMVGDGDVLVRSETGSGKTLAYGLPVLHALLTRCDTAPIDRQTGTVVLVMTPTRELADQCAGVLSRCVSKSAAFIVVGEIHGGEDRHKEKARLRKGVHVLVCTPGRMLDHVQNTAAFVHHNLHTLVLDEADRLLDMGFERSVTAIMNVVHPKKRVLVSATITPAVERLSHFALSNPTRIGETEDKFEVPASLRQHFVVVPCKQRLVALTAVLLGQLEAAAKKMVVFVSTADATEFLYLLYSRLASPFGKQRKAGDASGSSGFIRRNAAASAMAAGSGGSAKRATRAANRHVGDPDGVRGDDGPATIDGSSTSGGIAEAMAAARRAAAAAAAGATSGGGSSLEHQLADDDALLKCNVFKLHGNMNQVDRTSVFNAFRQCDSGVLFCTDVAARGLDMPLVNWIVHYDPPTDDRCYVHRIGRTARIGNIGESLLFLQDHERGFLEGYLANVTKSPIKEKTLGVFLYHLARLDPASERSWGDAAAKLDRAICTLVRRDEVLLRVSTFAYRSQIRAYSAYPRELKTWFDPAQLHLGHLANSFGIDATPSEMKRRTEKYNTEDRALGRNANRLMKGEGKGQQQLQIDTRETYHSSLATKAARHTKDWMENKKATGGYYHSLNASTTAEFDAA